MYKYPAYLYLLVNRLQVNTANFLVRDLQEMRAQR